RTLVLIEPVQYVLKQVLCRYETIPNAPKYYETRHLILQKLLPLVVCRILLEAVVITFIQLSNFFDALCSKELVEADLNRLSSSIREAVCRLEMLFPPSFFDIMMHLPVHLAEEAKLGGSVCYRWMYPVERYLCTVKGYVRNK